MAEFDAIIWIVPSQLEYRLDGRYNSAAAIAARQKIKDFGLHEKLKRLAKKISCGPFGSTLTSKEHDYNGQIILIQPTDISEGVFAQKPGWRINHNILRDKNLPLYPEGTLLFARVGIYPHSGVLPKRIGDATISSSMIAAVINNSVADEYFLHAFFQSGLGQTLLYSIQKVTAQPTISTEELSDLSIPMPDLGVQRAIGNKVRKAERLRELANNQWRSASALLSKRLGTQLVGDDEFNEFSPKVVSTQDYHCYSLSPPVVFASISNELGAQYFHPRRINAQQIATRTGTWQTLGTLATRIKKKRSGTCFIGLDSIDSETGFIDEDSLNEATVTGPSFENEDILFSRLRPYLNKVAIWMGGSGVGSGELLVYRVNSEIDPYYLFFLLKSPIGLYQVIDVTAGSTHPRVDESVVDAIRIPRFEDGEAAIADCVRNAFDFWREAHQLVPEAKADVGSLIQGSLDVDGLLRDGASIESWLTKNPIPVTEGRNLS
ncbi:MAG: hypothetical protein AB2605_02615 [Candidatus Thiodiazotropha sp.]